jgi:hypothetical protein
MRPQKGAKSHKRRGHVRADAQAREGGRNEQNSGSSMRSGPLRQPSKGNPTLPARMTALGGKRTLSVPPLQRCWCSKVLAAFAGSLAFLALCSKAIAWHSALYTAIGFKSSAELIRSRMRTVLNGVWWLLAAITSALFSSAFATRHRGLLIVTLLSIPVTIAYSAVRAHRLMKVAGREVGIPWPADENE